jgi:hypothetical protein
MSISLRHMVEFLSPDGPLPPPLGQTLILPLFTDGDTLLPPTVTQGPVPQSLTLSLFTDGDTLLLPIVTLGPGTQALVVPLFTDGNTLLPPTVQLGTPSLILPLFTDGNTLLPPTVTPGAAVLVLPVLMSTAVILPPLVHIGMFAVFAVAEDRIVGTAGPSMVRYIWGQTLEIRLTFTDADGVAAEPASVSMAYQSPDGVEASFTHGVNAEVEQVDVGIYRLQLTPDQHGRWFYRGEGASVAVHAAAEGSFVIRPSEFED